MRTFFYIEGNNQFLRIVEGLYQSNNRGNILLDEKKYYVFVQQDELINNTLIRKITLKPF